MAEASRQAAAGNKGERKDDKAAEKSVREANITAAKAVANTLRTSLGPRGMDKMIISGSGEVVITNDGATILAQMQLIHPAAKIVSFLFYLIILFFKIKY